MAARTQTLITAALMLLGAACSDTTAPVEARATVTVPDTVVASQLSVSAEQWMQFTIPVSIRNTASVPLTFFLCGTRIEAQNAGVWTNVWSPICSLSAGSDSPILPGETRAVTMTITASVAGAGGPLWGNASVAGTYRLNAALIPEGFSGTIPTISSNAFTLKQGQ